MADWVGSAPGISLRELFPTATIVGAEDIRVTGCSVDSRQCKAGDLFVGLPGSHCDGHDFAREAAERGASALLLNRPAPGIALPCCYVSDVAEAFGRLCQALAGQPSRRLKVVGITGTNGKTTTSHLTASVLSAAGFQTGVLGTLGYSDGMELVRARWTTPPANVLANWLARIEANGCSHAVMEVSSHALSQSRVAGVDFDVACVTNVRHDHLDYHATARHYRAAKARLFKHLVPEGFAIVNADDEICTSYLTKLDGPVLTVGLEAPAEITASPLEQLASEQTFLLSVGDETAPVRTPLVGHHNISNCLVAAAVGFVYGIGLSAIVRGLEAVQRMPGRLERIECGQPFSVFVDYAHTADALAGVLEALREFTQGRVICVFGAGGDRDRSKRPKMGRAVEERADLAIVTSDNPRSEHPATIAQEILQGFTSPSGAEVILDRREAIRRALAQAQTGDAVLIAGKGHEDYQIVGDQVLAFDDRQVAREWLYGFAAAERLHRTSA